LYQAPGAVTIKPFGDKTGLTFMPDALECTALKSTDGNYRETTCDYTITATSKIDGIEPILKNHAWGDYSYMTIRHPVGDVELSKFGNKIMFDDSVQNQGWIEPGYDAELVTGLKIRIHYFTKNTTNDVLIIMNMKLHETTP
jgi:hypothetical protein